MVTEQAQVMQNARRYQTLATELKDIDKTLNDDNQQLASIVEQLQPLRSQYKQQKVQLTDVQLIVEQQKTIMSLSEHRANLKTDQACPLCGSQQHPAIGDYQALSANNGDENEQQSRLKRLTLALEQLEQQGKTLSSAQDRLKEKLNFVGENQAVKQQEQQYLAQQWLTQRTLLGLDVELSEFAQIEAHIQARQQHFEQLNNANSQLQQLKQAQQQQVTLLTGQEKQLLTLSNQSQNQTLQLKQFRQQAEQNKQSLMLKLTQISQEWQKLSTFMQASHLTLPDCFTVFNQVDIDATQTDAAQDKFNALVQLQQAWINELEQQSSAYQTALSAVSIDNEQLQQLQQQRAIVDNNVEQLNTSEQSLKTELNALEQQLTEEKIKRHTLFGEQNTQQVRQQLKQQQQAQEQALLGHQNVLNEQKNLQQNVAGKLHGNVEAINRLTPQQQSANQVWQTQLADSEFATEAETIEQQVQQAKAQLQQAQQQLLQLEQDKALLQEQSHQLVDALQGNESSAAESHDEILKDLLFTQRVEINDQLDIATFDNKAVICAQILKQLQVRQGQLSQQVSQDKQQREEQKSVLANIVNQQAELDDLSHLNGLIGAKDGAKFRRFAQGLTLSHLVYLANQQLNRLHGRYQLQRQQSDNLALEVLDTWQADSVRDTKTLSGGESFLVSLALALALSDLVSAKTSIDSLFLDEGFGTLDNDTLEIALSALDSLNASGKMIGVISHVDALKKRIDVQIEVKKHSGLGVSELADCYRYLDN